MKMTIDEAREKLGGTKVHAVAIQKGGTGKTTITSDLCYTLAKMGFKVLAIDSDPQASLSGLCNKQDETLGLQTLHPIGVIPAAFFFALISYGCSALQINKIPVPSNMIDVLQGLVILVIVAAKLIIANPYLMDRAQRRLQSILGRKEAA